jgi:3-oxoadipate enol-lactonase
MVERRNGWVDAGGICQRYELSGSGAATVVLVHEMGGSIESWDAVVELLQGDHRLLRYDQRGFGLSEKNRDITLDQLVDDLSALLDALALDQPVVLAGAALGAAICIAFALRHPSRTAGLVLASPATGGMSAAAMQAMQQRLQKVRAEGMRGVADAMLNVTYPVQLREPPHAFELHRKRWLTIDPGSFIALNEMMAGFDLEPRLAAIACPVQVIGCTHDPIRPPSRSSEIAARMPRSNFLEAPSGHFMPLQSPALFADIVRRFVASLNDRDQEASSPPHSPLFAICSATWRMSCASSRVARLSVLRGEVPR